MNPNSDLKNENAMATNAKSSTVCSGYAESRISEYAARFAAYSDEQLKQTVDHERNVRGWVSERSYLLAALRGECEKRGIAFIAGSSGMFPMDFTNLSVLWDRFVKSEKQ